MLVKQKMVVFKDTPKCRSGAVVNGSVVAPSVPDRDLNLSHRARVHSIHVCKTENGCVQGHSKISVLLLSKIKKRISLCLANSQVSPATAGCLVVKDCPKWPKWGSPLCGS